MAYDTQLNAILLMDYIETKTSGSFVNPPASGGRCFPAS